VWHVLRLPVEFFGQRFAGDVSARIDSNDKVAALLAGGLSTNFVNLAHRILGFLFCSMVFTPIVSLLFLFLAAPRKV
jgi:ABC-type bacteriocin/lantibiotic exporter with double-glycine peptidase domain